MTRAVCRGVVMLGALLMLQSLCHAQSNKSGSPLTFQGAAEQTGSSIIRDALGRPCLDIEAVARAHVVNPTVMDHIVSVKNGCPRLIKIKVCYFGSDRCVEAVLGSYSRSDVTLGTMTGVKTFRYSISQK